MVKLTTSQLKEQIDQLLKIGAIIEENSEKKAVLLPYDEYEILMKEAIIKKRLPQSFFNQFVGILESDLVVDDLLYKSILK